MQPHLDAAERAGASVWRPETLGDLDAVAKGIAERRPSRVVVCGGDGTLMRVVSALARRTPKLPAFVLCHTGTVGLVRRSLGYRLSPGALIHRCITAPATLRQREIASLSARLDDAPLTTFSVGAGMVAGFFREYESRGAAGIGSAAAIALRIFVGSLGRSQYSRRILAPVRARLRIDDDHDATADYTLVICSVLTELGLYTRVTYRGGEDPERPHLVASQLSAGELGPQWPRVIRGLPLKGPGNVDRMVQRFSLEFVTPSPVVVDGDTTMVRRVEVHAGPRLRMLVA